MDALACPEERHGLDKLIERSYDRIGRKLAADTWLEQRLPAAHEATSGRRSAQIDSQRYNYQSGIDDHPAPSSRD
jgi:hypothetical protein